MFSDLFRSDKPIDFEKVLPNSKRYFIVPLILKKPSQSQQSAMIDVGEEMQRYQVD